MPSSNSVQFQQCRLTALSALFSAFVCTGEECLSQVEGGREEQEGSGRGETLYRCCYAGRVSAKPTGELGFCEGVCVPNQPPEWQNGALRACYERGETVVELLQWGTATKGAVET